MPNLSHMARDCDLKRKGYKIALYLGLASELSHSTKISVDIFPWDL